MAEKRIHWAYVGDLLIFVGGDFEDGEEGFLGDVGLVNALQRLKFGQQSPHR